MQPWQGLPGRNYQIFLRLKPCRTNYAWFDVWNQLQFLKPNQCVLMHEYVCIHIYIIFIYLYVHTYIWCFFVCMRVFVFMYNQCLDFLHSSIKHMHVHLLSSWLLRAYWTVCCLLSVPLLRIVDIFSSTTGSADSDDPDWPKRWMCFAYGLPFFPWKVGFAIRRSSLKW